MKIQLLIIISHHTSFVTSVFDIQVRSGLWCGVITAVDQFNPAWSLVNEAVVSVAFCHLSLCKYFSTLVDGTPLFMWYSPSLSTFTRTIGTTEDIEAAACLNSIIESFYQNCLPLTSFFAP